MIGCLLLPDHGAMLLRLTPQLRQVLQEAAGDESVPKVRLQRAPLHHRAGQAGENAGISRACPPRSVQDLREAAAAGAASGATVVAWDTVKAVMRHTRERKGVDAAPSLQQVHSMLGVGALQRSSALAPQVQCFWGLRLAMRGLCLPSSLLSAHEQTTACASILPRCAPAAVSRFRSPASRRASRPS